MKEFDIIFAPIRPDYIEKALSTLYKYNDPEIFQVIVIDQTKNGLYDLVKDKTHVYVRSKRPNLGFAKAMNTGMRLAVNSEYIIASNDDIEFIDSRWWQGIKDKFAQIDNLMAVNPMCPKEPGWGWGMDRPDFVPPNWAVQEGAFLFPKKPDGTGFFYKEEFTPEDYDWLLKFKQGHIEGMAAWMPVFKREAVNAVGLFDERFYPGGAEDYDWVARCYSAGYRCVCTCNSWVWHHWTVSRHMPELR